MKIKLTLTEKTCKNWKIVLHKTIQNDKRSCFDTLDAEKLCITKHFGKKVDSLYTKGDKIVKRFSDEEIWSTSSNFFC